MNRIDHAAWESRIGALADGELSAEEERLTRQHLEGCVDCSRDLARLNALSRAMRALPRERMPADLKAAILRDARGGARAGAPVTRRPWALATLATAAVAVIVSVVVWRSLPAPPASVPLASKEQTPAAPPAAGGETGPAAPSAANTLSQGAATSDDHRFKDAAPLDKLARSGDVAAGTPLRRQPKQQEARRAEPRPARHDEQIEAKPSDERAERDQLDAGNLRESEKTASAAPPPTAALAPQASAAPTLAPRESNRVVARYSTRLIQEPGRSPRLAAITPRPIATQKKALADRRTLVLTFLAMVDADGRILSAAPIGARAGSAATTDTAHALLVGATITPFEARRAMSVVVDVEVEEPPPAPPLP